MNVLQIPIEDNYFSGPDPRRDGFAQQKGFGVLQDVNPDAALV
jgi:hypothetical protein